MPEQKNGLVRETPPKFAFGKTVITRHALETLTHEDVLNALSRHAKGDWGDVDADDWEANERALRDGDRLVSVYHPAGGRKFYIITEWNRSYTTVMLPEDY